MEEKYIFQGKEFKDSIEFLKFIHKQDFNKIKNEFIEIKCPIHKFIEGSDIVKSEILADKLREKPQEIVEAIIKELNGVSNK